MLPLDALMAPDCCGPVDISAKVLAIPWQGLALQQSPSPSPQSMSDAGVATAGVCIRNVIDTDSSSQGTETGMSETRWGNGWAPSGAPRHDAPSPTSLEMK